MSRRPRGNGRRAEVMDLVQAEVERHYSSALIDRIAASDGELTIARTTVRLARQFGFCYGVERAIDLSYASRRVFPDSRIHLIGEIIHNPEVNRQLAEMGVATLPWQSLDAHYEDLGPDDVVLVPAFGAPTEFMDKLDARGCSIVDTTCGDVMKVWRRVRQNARDGATSIIHGKAGHEETRATASRALGDNGKGHYLIVFSLEDVSYLCECIRTEQCDKKKFLSRFPENSHSPGFDPNIHLRSVGVANQTTMLKSETEEIQRRIRHAIAERDGDDGNFRMFDTICGATQERQDALFDMLRTSLDLLVVVGGYNSSNTSHLVEIGADHLPTFFIRNASCLRSLEEIHHFDLARREEIEDDGDAILAREGPLTVGITAGASCPANLIEGAILKIFELRGVPRDKVIG
jgi:4-hydroxy-3-methylbut-2-enyl diphosphate reductase